MHVVYEVCDQVVDQVRGLFPTAHILVRELNPFKDALEETL